MQNTWNETLEDLSMIDRSIANGWYDAKIIAVRPRKRFGIRSGMKVDLLLEKVGQEATYYISAGAAGYFSRKNFCYFADYPYHRKDRYDEKRLVDRYIRVYVESHVTGRKRSVMIREFAFSEKQLFATRHDTDSPENSNTSRRPAA